MAADLSRVGLYINPKAFADMVANFPWLTLSQPEQPADATHFDTCFDTDCRYHKLTTDGLWAYYTEDGEWVTYDEQSHATVEWFATI